MIHEKLSSLTDRINSLLDGSNSICLWFSGGADSTLLLQVMSATGKAFDVLRFEDGLSREQRGRTDAIILNLKNKPMVFSYPARQMLLIGDTENISTVAWYPVSGGASMPIMRDLVPGEKCYFEAMPPIRAVEAAPAEYYHHIIGLRGDDRHWSLGTLLPDGQEEFQIGARRFYAPLLGWNRQEVIEALAILDVEWEQPSDDLDSGNIACCFACIKSERPVFCPKAGKLIESAAWDRQENLQLFQRLMGRAE